MSNTDKILSKIYDKGDKVNYNIIDALQNSVKKKIIKKSRTVKNTIDILNESSTFSNVKTNNLNKNKKLRNIDTYINGNPNICKKTNLIFYGLKSSFIVLEVLKFKKK